MRNTVICAVLWALTVVLAWLLGSHDGDTSDDRPGLVDADVAVLESENERLRALLEEHAPGLEGVGPGAAPTRPVGAGAANGGTRQPDAGSGERLDDFDPNRTADPNEMLALLRSYAREMFSKGREGHLQLLKTLDQLMKTKGLEDRLGRREEEQWRYLYPMVRFLVQNEQHVVDMAETIYEEMATNPKAFADLDKDVLEIFADEGIGPILPAVVDRERLERFRTLAKQILATPEDQQSEAIRRSRNEIERSLALWWPEVTKDEAFEQLRGGSAESREVVGYLRKLDPSQLEELDLGRLLGPAIEAGDRSAVDLLQALTIDGRAVADLDDALLRGALAGTVQGWALARYLSGTNRKTWVEARPLVERGLGAGAQAGRAFADAVRHLDQRPDADWVVWMLDTFVVDPTQANRLRREFGIK